jgi:hypothetical protein
MIRAPYRTDGVPYDIMFENNIKYIRDYIQTDDDDYQLMMVGIRGAGKSNLAEHALSIYMPSDRLNINQIALTQNQLASSWKIWAKEAKPRALCYDEANVSGRNAMTKWNKDLIDIYFSNRGQNIFHIWCNPSVSNIDRTFLHDCIKGIIVVKKPTKKSDAHQSPFRYYYWYKKKSLLKMLDDNISLKINNLLSPKVAEKYAWYMGWFKRYDGILMMPYLAMKDGRMNQKTEDFYKKYGTEELIGRGEVIRQLGISEMTAMAHMKDLKEGEDYFTTPTGRYKFTASGIESLKRVIKRKRSVPFD